MIRQLTVYLALSILVVFFAKYAHLLVVYVDTFFTYLNLKLAPIFSQTGWGLIVQKTLVLMLLPIILVGIPALAFRAIRGREMPHYIAACWVLWTIIVVSDILIK